MRAVLVPLAIDLALPPAGSVLRKLAGRTMGTGWSASMLLPPGFMPAPRSSPPTSTR